MIEILYDCLTPNPWNRKRFDEAKLVELAASIEKVGILQPIVVREREDVRGAKYEIVAGERRWRAAKGILDTVPATVRELTTSSSSSSWRSRTASARIRIRSRRPSSTAT